MTTTKRKADPMMVLLSRPGTPAQRAVRTVPVERADLVERAVRVAVEEGHDPEDLAWVVVHPVM